jgi:predicted 3-demethylubiquinone-9 3-methyltransferase (glyoxalase superfamily)
MKTPISGAALLLLAGSVIANGKLQSPSLREEEQHMQRISPFLWFDTQAEEAATFYTSVFKNSRITGVTRYDETAAKTAGREAGSAMTVAFQLDGQPFVALNGGPHFQFSEAVSFVVNCETQKEVDYYWEKLSEGGDPNAQQCGWLKDKYGLSWQIIPSALMELMQKDKSGKVTAAMLQMKKIDIEALKKAYEER